MERAEARTAKKYYTLVFCELFISEVTGTVFTLYMLYKGMNLFDVNITLAVYFGSILLLEIPTGIIADLYGRKTSMVLGFAFYALAGVMFLNAMQLATFLFAEVLSAIGATLLSGAMEAWMVDSLGNENPVLIEKIFANAGMVRQGAGMICGMIGATLAAYSFQAIWVLSIAFSLITVVYCLFYVKEPLCIKKGKPDKNPLQAMKQIASDSVKYSFGNKELVVFFAIAILINISNSAGNSFQQPRLVGLFDNKIWIMGWVKFLYSLTMMAGAWLVGYLCRKKVNHLVILGITGGILGVFQILSGALNSFGPVLATFLLYEVGRGMYNPIAQIYLNSRIESGMRASVLSFSSAFSQIGMIIGLILTGILSNLYVQDGTMQNAIRISWIFCGSVAMIAAVISKYVSNSKASERG